MAHERICYIHLSIRTTSRRESSMRLNKFAVPTALNYVSEDRINQFKTSETVAPTPLSAGSMRHRLQQILALSSMT